MDDGASNICLADFAHRVIGCTVTQETRAQTTLKTDDVARNICVALG